MKRVGERLAVGTAVVLSIVAAAVAEGERDGVQSNVASMLERIKLLDELRPRWHELMERMGGGGLAVAVVHDNEVVFQ